ncbi:hypothetical protein ARMGADRAFT_1029680 [Armillaria gallica]|uniref:Uncharacterized protein n=1 Tax=Armillaria gallica TaxID=47427 RepID=A0A2H3DZR7_ARMGA|nr:hypothetical protein ARMGADRAFT_1029680 [Armillaria gallica]
MILTDVESRVRTQFHRNDPERPRRRLTGDHRAARAGKTQKVWQGDEGDGVLDLILGTLWGSLRVGGRRHGIWLFVVQRLGRNCRRICCVVYEAGETADSLLAGLQELVERACQLENMGLDCRSAVDDAMMVTEENYEASTFLSLPSVCFIQGPVEFQLASMDSSGVVSTDWKFCYDRQEVQITWRVYDSRYTLAANQGVLVVGVAA